MLRFKWLVLGALLAVSVLGAVFLFKLIPRPGQVGRVLSEAFREKLGLSPAIRIQDWVVVEERKPIAELALVSRDADIGHRIKSIRLGSEAELDLRSAFRVKAGFDLRAADFSLRLDANLKQAWLDLPAPRVLSVEMIHYDVLADRRGWWNRISEDEKALAMRDMQARAKLEAIRAGILGDCRQRLEAELAQVSSRTGVRITARYRMGGADTAALKLRDAASTAR
jgi:hypothetical protein